MKAKTGFTATGFSGSSHSVSRGTYSTAGVCAVSYDGAFAEDVSFGITAGVISLYPASISAKLGDADTCGMLGAAASAQLSTYLVYWTKTDGASYLGLPALEVDVTDGA